MDHQPMMAEAIREARKGMSEGGIPIGSVLVKDGKIIGRGHNRRVQKGSAILHAEMDCLENAGRFSARNYQICTIYSTLSPCDMCTGAILLYQIPTVVIGENETFRGPEEYSEARGVTLMNLDLDECKQLCGILSVNTRNSGTKISENKHQAGDPCKDICYELC